MKRLVILAMLIVGVASPALATKQGTMGWLLEQANDPQVKRQLDRRLKTMEDAYGWANVELKEKGGTALYCPPQKLLLKGNQLFDIWQRYLKDRAFTLTQPAWYTGMFLLEALKNVFPCPK